MIRVVLIDDEKPARDKIRRMMRDHAGFEIVGEAADVTSAVELINREHPDLCFLDVQMPGGDGFDVLRQVEHLPRVIFATAFEQYAVRAFQVHSIDYLLKPFDRKRLATSLQRAQADLQKGDTARPALLQLLDQLKEDLPRLSGLAEKALQSESPDPASGAEAPPAPSRPDRIPARLRGRIVLLDPGEVHYFEAETTLVYARTSEGRFLVEKTLADLEAVLTPGFFRAHRSYLVNLSVVGELLPEEGGTYRIRLKDAKQTLIPLSRRQARRLKEQIGW